MFVFLVACLRFDNASDKKLRKGTDKAVAVFGFSKKLVQNCQKSFYVGCYGCIGDMTI
jgi:hypothetical protein